MRLLLAEDEKMMAEAVVAYLSYHGHQVECAEDGRAALEMALLNDYDCLILDVMMPGMDGVSALKQYRKEGGMAPAIFLTAKSALEDKAHGFEAGGDDYLTKPFALEELLLRIHAMAKRGRAILSDKTTFSDLVLDRDACIVWCGSASCSLSRRELQLLEFFMRNPHVFFSVDVLLDRVWGFDTEVEQGTVWVHISYLRKKFEQLGAHAVIASKRGIGYALEEAT